MASFSGRRSVLLGRASASSCRQPVGDLRHQLGDPLAMLGRHRERFPQPELERIQHRRTRVDRPSALFATSSTCRPCRRSHWAKCWSAGVTPVRASTTNTTRSAAAVATPAPSRIRPGERLRRRFLQPRGIDQPHAPAAQQRLGLLAVARHAGRVGHQRQPPPGQPVEQRALADVRPSGNHHQRGASRLLSAAPAACRRPSPRTRCRPPRSARAMPLPTGPADRGSRRYTD